MGGGCKEVGVRMGSVEEEEGWWLVFGKRRWGLVVRGDVEDGLCTVGYRRGDFTIHVWMDYLPLALSSLLATHMLYP